MEGGGWGGCRSIGGDFFASRLARTNLRCRVLGLGGVRGGPRLTKITKMAPSITCSKFPAQCHGNSIV